MSSSRIPKVIYQTWKTKDLDPNMQAAMQTWIDMNPEYEHRLFDDAECRAFIEKHFPARVLKAYEKLGDKKYLHSAIKSCDYLFSKEHRICLF